MNRFSQFLVVFLISSLMFSCEKTTEDSKKGQLNATEDMLQHNVYFYLKDSISKEEKKSFEKGLDLLLTIDAIYKTEIGITADTKSRDVTDHEFDYSIFVWFQSMEDYEIYADHPDHMKFIDENKHLWTQVKVYDSKITSAKK